MRVKRSDLSTAEVMAAVTAHGTRAWDALCEIYPPKVVRAAFQREVTKGRLDYGVCIERSFIAEG